MSLLDQHTTPETSRALIALGMPVPEPEIGQVWYNPEGTIKVLVIENNKSYLNTHYYLDRNEVAAVKSVMVTPTPSFIELCIPAFTAPEIMAWAYHQGVDIRLTLDHLSDGENQKVGFTALWRSFSFDINSNPAEAVALAVIKAMRDEK